MRMHRRQGADGPQRAAALRDTRAARATTKQGADRSAGTAAAACCIAVTPRFAATSSAAQLDAAGALWREHPGTYLQSHVVGEPQRDRAGSASSFPSAPAISTSTITIGRSARARSTVTASGSTEDDLARVPRDRHRDRALPDVEHLPRQRSVHVCTKRASADAPVRVALATDLGGGTRFSMLRTMHEAYKVAQLNGHSLSAVQAFYLATRGGAHALYLDDRIGSIAPGMEADLVVLDLESTPLIACRMAHCARPDGGAVRADDARRRPRGACHVRRGTPAPTIATLRLAACWSVRCAIAPAARMPCLRVTAPCRAALTIALSKGRIFDETLPLLAAAGIAPAEDPETSRKLIIGSNRADVRFIIVRASDVPTYVQHGAADLGVAGKDVLLEHGGDGLYQPLDLGIGRCRMVVATTRGFDYAGAVQRGARLRVATKYVVDRARALRRQGHARRPDQALRLDGARAAGRAGRRHRRSGQQRQHAQGQRSGRGRGHHADQRAPDRQSGVAQAQARR